MPDRETGFRFQYSVEKTEDKGLGVFARDIERGEEFANDYSADDDCPPYYDVLYEQFGVCEDFLNDC